MCSVECVGSQKPTDLCLMHENSGTNLWGKCRDFSEIKWKIGEKKSGEGDERDERDDTGKFREKEEQPLFSMTVVWCKILCEIFCDYGTVFWAPLFLSAIGVITCSVACCLMCCMNDPGGGEQWRNYGEGNRLPRYTECTKTKWSKSTRPPNYRIATRVEQDPQMKHNKWANALVPPTPFLRAMVIPYPMLSHILLYLSFVP